VRDLPRVVWVLAAGRFVNAAGSFVYFYLFLYLTGPRHLSLGLAGVLSGAVGLGSLLGNLTGGWFGDRLGHRRALLLASTVSGVGTLAVPALPVAVLAVVLPVVWYASATAGVSQGALVALAVPAGDRRRSVALSRASFNAGSTIGPLLGAVLYGYSPALMFVLDGIVTLVVRAATARLLKADPHPGRGDGPPVPLWRALSADRGLLILLPAIVVVDVVYRQLYSTLPVFLRDHGHPVGLYATLNALGCALILCLELPTTIALRRFPASVVIGTGYGLVGVGFALFSPATTGFVVTAMVVLTFGEILYKTTATAHVLDAAPAGLVGRYQGLYTAAATSGNILSAPLGAAVYSSVPALLWPLCSVAAVAAGVGAWLSGRVGLTTPVVVTETVTTTGGADGREQPPDHRGTRVGLDGVGPAARMGAADLGAGGGEHQHQPGDRPA
jgi:MFS family permease